MRIVLFADNYVGLKITELLRRKNENVVGLFVHPEGQRHFTNEIVSASGLPSERIQTVGKKWSEENLEKLKGLLPDIILVVFWNYILPRKVFEIPPKGCVNFHLSYLPFNRGKKPNVWPIMDGTPAGISLHYVDEGIDSGKIIARRKIDVELSDTACSLYNRLIVAFPRLFEENLAKIKAGDIEGIGNSEEKGTFHLDREFDRLEEIDLNEKMYPLDLINRLRAKTFPPHPSAFFVKNNRKVYVRVELEEISLG